MNIPPLVHLSPAKGSPYGKGATARAYPCGAPLWPPGGPTVANVLDYLDVENAPRYRREPGKTFCNIYAHDFLHLMGLYLPRVWWLAPGQASGLTRVIYGTTVGEMNANALCDWATQWGPNYGWGQADEAAIQARVDAAGLPGFVVARAPGRVGHIAVILPTGSVEAPAGDGPLQSQAGASNNRVFRGRWWANRRHGFDQVRFCYPVPSKVP